MEILLAIGLLLAILTIGILYFQLKKKNKEYTNLKKQAISLSKKELEFLEFSADMYIKYAEELNLYSKEHHEYIITELEKVRKKVEEKINSLHQE